MALNRPRAEFILCSQRNGLTNKQYVLNKPLVGQKVSWPLKTLPFDPVRVTMKFLGAFNPHQSTSGSKNSKLEKTKIQNGMTSLVNIKQKMPEGATIDVFSDLIKPSDIISFLSYRGHENAFSLTITINGKIVSKLSTCCEYRFRSGRKRVGGPSGLFEILDVSGGQPCWRCRASRDCVVRRLKRGCIKTDTSLRNYQTYARNRLDSLNKKYEKSVKGSSDGRSRHHQNANPVVLNERQFMVLLKSIQKMNLSYKRSISKGKNEISNQTKDNEKKKRLRKRNENDKRNYCGWSSESDLNPNKAGDSKIKHSNEVNIDDGFHYFSSSENSMKTLDQPEYEYSNQIQPKYSNHIQPKYSNHYPISNFNYDRSHVVHFDDVDSKNEDTLNGELNDALKAYYQMNPKIGLTEIEVFRSTNNRLETERRRNRYLYNLILGKRSDRNGPSRVTKPKPKVIFNKNLTNGKRSNGKGRSLNRSPRVTFNKTTLYETFPKLIVSDSILQAYHQVITNGPNDQDENYPKVTVSDIVDRPNYDVDCREMTSKNNSEESIDDRNSQIVDDRKAKAKVTLSDSSCQTSHDVNNGAVNQRNIKVTASENFCQKNYKTTTDCKKISFQINQNETKNDDTKIIANKEKCEETDSEIKIICETKREISDSIENVLELKQELKNNETGCDRNQKLSYNEDLLNSNQEQSYYEELSNQKQCYYEDLPNPEQSYYEDLLQRNQELKAAAVDRTTPSITNHETNEILWGTSRELIYNEPVSDTNQELFYTENLLNRNQELDDIDIVADRNQEPNKILRQKNQELNNTEIRYNSGTNSDRNQESNGILKQRNQKLLNANETACDTNKELSDNNKNIWDQKAGGLEIIWISNQEINENKKLRKANQVVSDSEILLRANYKLIEGNEILWKMNQETGGNENSWKINRETGGNENSWKINKEADGNENSWKINEEAGSKENSWKVNQDDCRTFDSQIMPNTNQDPYPNHISICNQDPYHNNIPSYNQNPLKRKQNLKEHRYVWKKNQDLDGVEIIWMSVEELSDENLIDTNEDAAVNNGLMNLNQKATDDYENVWTVNKELSNSENIWKTNEELSNSENTWMAYQEVSDSGNIWKTNQEIRDSENMWKAYQEICNSDNILCKRNEELNGSDIGKTYQDIEDSQYLCETNREIDSENFYPQIKSEEIDSENIYTQIKSEEIDSENIYSQIKSEEIDSENIYPQIKSEEIDSENFYPQIKSEEIDSENCNGLAEKEESDMQGNECQGDSKVRMLGRGLIKRVYW